MGTAVTAVQKPISVAHSHNGKVDVVGFIAITVGWIVMAALANPIGDFPLNDDWIYAGAAKSIVERGYFWIPGPAIPNLLAHAYWGALFSLPFGFSFTALRVSTLTLGLVALLALYWLLRRVGGSPGMALLGAAVLAVNPTYFNLANSFMTDVPFLCLAILAIFFIAQGLGRPSSLAMMIGLALVFIAIMIRQTGVFMLVGFALAYPMRHGFRLATLLRGALPLACGLALHFGFQHWVIATGRVPDLVLGDVHALIPTSLIDFATTSLRSTILMTPYLGAFVFPFVIMSGRLRLSGISPQQERLARFVLIGLALLFMAFIVWKHDGLPGLTNMILVGGVGPLTLLDGPRLQSIEPGVTSLAGVLWLAATGFGVAGAFLLFDRLVRGGIAAWRSFRGGTAGWDAWLYMLVVGSAGAYWAGILMLTYWDHMLFDRYILYFVPFAMIAVMCTQRPGTVVEMKLVRAVLAGACLLVYAAFAVVGAHDYIAWNRSRWRALDYLMTAEHVAPNQINGGYEFNGWMQHDQRYAPRPERLYWAYWGDRSDAYVIAFGPIAGYQEIGRFPVDRWLGSTAAELSVLHKQD